MPLILTPLEPSPATPTPRLRHWLHLSFLCLFFSSSIWEFRVEIRSLHSCNMACFLVRGEAALSHIP